MVRNYLYIYPNLSSNVIVSQVNNGHFHTTNANTVKICEQRCHILKELKYYFAASCIDP